MSTRFYVGQKDYITQLNAMDDAINAAGSVTSPSFVNANIQKFLNIGDAKADAGVVAKSAASGGGVQFLAQNALGSIIGIGNKSAFYGGAYDASPMLYGNTTILVNQGMNISGQLNTTQSAVIGNGTFDTSLQVNGTGTSHGSSIGTYVNGSPIVVIGNKSGVMGGNYDATPYIYSQFPLNTSQSLVVGGTLSASVAANLSTGNFFNGLRGANCVVNIGTAGDTKNGNISIAAQGNEYAAYGVQVPNSGSVYSSTGTLAYLSDNSGIHIWGNPNEKMRLDSGGNLSLSGGGIKVGSSATSELIRGVSDQGYISFNNTANSDRTAYIQGTYNSGLVLMVEKGTALDLGVGFLKRVRLDAGGLYPYTDNNLTLGVASLRWGQIFSASSTISTSDAREKTSVSKMTDAEIAAAKELGKEIGTYKWLSSVKNKGEDARTHIGMTVQNAIEIMKSHGLEPFDYGFICYDKWDAVTEQRHINPDEMVTKTRTHIREVPKMEPAEVEVTEVKMIDGVAKMITETKTVYNQVFKDELVFNPDGTPLMQEVEELLSDTLIVVTEKPSVKQVQVTHKVPVTEIVEFVEEYKEAAEPKYETITTTEAGDRYGFRYDELNMFIAAGFEARLHALESK